MSTSHTAPLLVGGIQYILYANRVASAVSHPAASRSNAAAAAAASSYGYIRQCKLLCNVRLNGS